MIMQGGFDANAVEPKQGGVGNHPVGRFPFSITDTEIKENKDKEGGQFVVEFTTPAGVAYMRYNLWNKSQDAVNIAQGQLSALCRAVGRFQISWQDEGAALRGGQGMLEVGFQKDQGVSAERPNGGYTEVKKVFDSAGNEPGKAPSAAQSQLQNPNPGGGAPMTSQQGGGWNNNANPNPNPNPNPAPNPASGGWQQGGAANPNAGAANPNPSTPPWGQR